LAPFLIWSIRTKKGYRLSIPKEKVTDSHGNALSIGASAKKLVTENASNELVFAVVGHVGSGTSDIAKMLIDLLSDSELHGGSFDTVELKARDAIIEWANENGKDTPKPASKKLDVSEKLQDLGDMMRRDTKDYAAVAKSLVLKIREKRADKVGQDSKGNDPIKPDGKRRAYILDSLRHPAEVELLRKLYQEAFVLIGIVCEEDIRLSRIETKYSDAGEDRAKSFMLRDSKAKEKYGQRVSDTFHLSDYFLDNSISKTIDDGISNDEWNIADNLSRLIKIITHAEIVRPYLSETAMYQAFGAKMKSACLSRQVGAALLDKDGNVVAAGTNEVPLAGGGVYGEEFELSERRDHRCAYRETAGSKPCCSNTKEQNEIIDFLIDDLSELNTAKETRKHEIKKHLKDSRIGELLEFSRAVHAEMDALLSAARSGVSTVGTRMYVTTFPCHYCARHIVTAGVDEVQFIEPYLKSRALSLHRDSITLVEKNWIPPSKLKAGQEKNTEPKVWFHPFTGVAPRLYKRAFLKDRELKNEDTGVMDLQKPQWGTPWHLSNISYIQLEAELKKNA